MGLGDVPPWAFRHRSLLKTRLGSSPMPQLSVLPAGPSKPPENKITAVGSTKRLPWSHNNILRLVRYPSCGVLPSRQQSSVSRLPGTPPPSVYQVTHSTALQAAERHVEHMSCGWYPTTCRTSTCMAKCLFLFIALARMVTFYKEGGGMLSVWALRARSYKTRAEA